MYYNTVLQKTNMLSTRLIFYRVKKWRCRLSSPKDVSISSVEAVSRLGRCAGAYGEGQVVTLILLHAELSTQQVADLSTQERRIPIANVAYSADSQDLRGKVGTNLPILGFGFWILDWVKPV